MKPFLVKHKENNTLWWAVDVFVRTKLDYDGVGRPSTCWKLMSIDISRAMTIHDWPEKYTILPTK